MNINAPTYQVENLDVSTLTWVKDEIGRSLQETEQALQDFISQPENKTPLRYGATYLHQVFATLQMVEIFGAALLAEEMEKTAKALYAGEKILRNDDALGALMRAIMQLPAYLENLARGQPDIPAALSPLINDLRSARGETPLTNSAFFHPDLDITPPQESKPDDKPVTDIQAYARKLRPVFQAALLAWLRDNHRDAQQDQADKSSLKKLAAVLRELQKKSTNSDAQRSWWIMAGVIEALHDDGLKSSGPLNLLLSHMDAEIKRLIHHGEAVFSEAPPQELLKNCLYHIARAQAQGPLVSALQNAFKLTQLLPTDATLDQAVDALQGSTHDILDKVSEIIKGDLLEVNNSLEAFVLDGQQDREALQPLVGILNRSASTLEMLGRQDLRKLTRDQADVLQRYIRSTMQATDDPLMDVASSLIYIESSLNTPERAGVAIAMPSNSEGHGSATPGQWLPGSELQNIREHVFEQSLDELSFVKTGLNLYAEQAGQVDNIRDIPEKLQQIIGTLEFMGLERPARQVTSISAFIENILRTPNTNASAEQLDTLADAITSIEFFFEALAEGRRRPEAVLTVADISLEQLGYPSSNTGAIPSPSTAVRPPALVEHNSGSGRTVIEQAHPGHPVHDGEDKTRKRDTDVRGELHAVFAAEAQDLVKNIEHHFTAWQQTPEDEEALAELRRAYHTLKGSGRLAGATLLSEFAGAVETVLSRVINRTLTPDVEILDLLQQAQDLLPELMDAYAHAASGNLSRPSRYDELYNTARTLAAAPQAGQGDLQSDLHHRQFVTATTDSDLTRVFREEAQTHLTTIWEFLHQAGSTHPVRVTEQLHQAVQTLNGSARMAHIELIARLSQPLNSLLQGLYKNSQPLGAEALTILRSFAETVESVVAQLDNPQAVDTDYQRLLKQIQALQGDVDGTKTTSLERATQHTDEAMALNEATENVPEMLAVFLEEAEASQENIERILQQWTQDISQAEPVAELQRSLHTLKGSARLANLTAIGDLAHAMESLLEGILARRFPPREEHLILFQHCHDWLAHALEQANRHGTIEPAESLLVQLEQAITTAGQATADPSPPEPHDAPPSAPTTTEAQSSNLDEIVQFIETFGVDAEQQAEPPRQAELEDHIRVRSKLLDELVNHSTEINIYNTRINQQLQDWQAGLTELQHTVDRLREQLRHLEIEADKQEDTHLLPDAGAREGSHTLEADRSHNTQQLTRSMLESLGDLSSIEHTLLNITGETGELLTHQQRITRELQEGLMRTRMVLFSSIFPRLRRVIRQTCNETRKYAELTTHGSELELDRNQLSRMVAIIEHILRNAVDHGIESPQQREQLGKNRIGQIYLDYAQRGSEIELCIRDDGAGFNIPALHQHAIEIGLIDKDAQMSEQEILDLVRQSGFSTAETLTQISGRGVGLNVVSTEVEKLGGKLLISSTSGKGASFTLTFPLNMLINQALLVRVADASYAIQLPYVEQVLDVSSAELEPLLAGENSIYSYGGHDYPYMNLGHILYGKPSPLPAPGQRSSLLLLRSGEQRLAAHADQYLGRQDILIKSLGPQLADVDILSGASILPDGQIALILDVGKLSDIAPTQTGDVAQMPLPSLHDTGNNKTSSLNVLIVDDSITVRKVTSSLLARYNYHTCTAKDGVEALQIMQQTVPDILLVDVEMPHMDGYQLTAQVREHPQLRHIPIIMITSRNDAKHRQQAMDVGVNHFMGKPFQEQELIAHIRRLSGEIQGMDGG